MSDPRWNDPPTEADSDVDSIVFQPSPVWARLRRRRRLLLVFSAFAVGTAVGAVAVTRSSPPAHPAAQSIEAPSPDVPQPLMRGPAPAAPVWPAPDPSNPRGRFRAHCAASLDVRGNERSAPRFVTEVSFANSGNIGMSYRVVTTWYALNYRPVRRVARQDVPPGATVIARLAAPVTTAQVVAHEAMPSYASCATKVTLLSTFEETYGRPDQGVDRRQP